MEADRESISGHRSGMENGFNNSPMAKLIRQYKPEDVESQHLSTQTKVQLIIDVEDLGPKMIIDRGSERPSGLPHYHLAPKDLARVQSTIAKLQIFLQQAARISVAAVRLAANQLAEPVAFAGCGLWLFGS